VILVPLPSTLGGSRQGTSHGSGYSYDTHVPILFYGNGIQKGKSSEPYYIRDIAPTLATLLQVEFPNGTTGKVIAEALK
jgi:bisphosphoglycerate-independent phosphoglycerate mutase (AlkP superfamily)